MSPRTASDSNLAKESFGPLAYSDQSFEQIQEGTSLDTMARTSNGANGSYAPEAGSSNPFPIHYFPAGDKKPNGANGIYAAEAEPSNPLNMCHFPAGDRKPTGYANGTSKKYQFDREYRVQSYDLC